MESPAACPDGSGETGRHDSPEAALASRSSAIRIKSGIVLPGRRFPDRLRGRLARRPRKPDQLTRTAIR